MRRLLVGSIFAGLILSNSPANSQAIPNPTRLREVFSATTLFDVDGVDPTDADRNGAWEVLYSPREDSLWITENRNYRIRKIHPTNGGNRVVLDLSQSATQFSGLNRNFATSANPWPQGGMMGLALHPQFLAPTDPKNFVYLAYVRSYTSGQNFSTSIVRFTWNTATAALESPVQIITNIPGSGDHNSGRMIIAPWGGQDFLFYAVGDMGAGQFSNVARTVNSQNLSSLEGKILRINLEPDNDPLPAQQWIPNLNPYNSGEAIPVTQSFV